MVEKGIRLGVCHAIHWYVKANNKYMRDYDQNNKDKDAGCFCEVHVQYPEEPHELHDNLPFSPERMKNERVKKVSSNMYEKKELNHGLLFKRVDRVFKTNQTINWSEAELREKSETWLSKRFFQVE